MHAVPVCRLPGKRMAKHALLLALLALLALGSEAKSWSQLCREQGRPTKVRGVADGRR
jgi:hypothetical protein